MTITTIQKVIKIGSSRGVILPASQLKALGVDVGDEVKVTFRKVANNDCNNKTEVSKESEDFKKQCGDTLQNLADRRDY